MNSGIVESKRLDCIVVSRWARNAIHRPKESYLTWKGRKVDKENKASKVTRVPSARTTLFVRSQQSHHIRTQIQR